MIEWSTTRSTGTSGSIVFGSLPICLATVRIAARSASSGTPVKSCSTTRATTNGISLTRSVFGCQLASSATCSLLTFLPSQLRSTLSRTMRIETGSRFTFGKVLASSGSEKNWPSLPEAVLKLLRVFAKAWAGTWVAMV
jgi:hypothetical protein